MSNCQTRRLQFKNPGRFMEDFNPECSQREMRKVQRKFYRENSRGNRQFDDRGTRLADGLDVCDCLVKDCPGCHFPCPRCSSPKCGSECRRNRAWAYAVVENEGTNTRITADGTGKTGHWSFHPMNYFEKTLVWLSGDFPPTERWFPAMQFL